MSKVVPIFSQVLFWFRAQDPIAFACLHLYEFLFIAIKRGKKEKELLFSKKGL